MDKNFLEDLLNKVAGSEMSPAEALRQLEHFPYQELNYAKIDHHRHLRSGFPEVIFCEGKEPGQVEEIFYELSRKNVTVLATRAGDEVYRAVKNSCPDAVYYRQGRCILKGSTVRENEKDYVLVISAGTADIPVAEEAYVCAGAMGCPVKKLYDVGVAGIHRLLDSREVLDGASIVIVTAGMEGALASVVGGLTDKPVIAVPTSVGYGASFGGLAALLAMLNSCAMGIGVMNIDNGFGAAAMARSIYSLARGE